MAGDSTRTTIWRCELCDYKTDRRSNFKRHQETGIHQNVACFQTSRQVVNDVFDVPCSKQTFDMSSDQLICSDDEDTDCLYGNECPDRDCENEKLVEDNEEKTGKWFPFSSKIEFYLYVLMNSTTHPVSDEVVKFVIHILKQCGVEGIPSLNTVKRRKFGTFDWNDFLLQGMDGDSVPMWIVRPSSVAKLAIAHPDFSKSLVRFPKYNTLDGYNHPSCGGKWRNDLTFHSAAIQEDQQILFFKDEICSFEVNGSKQLGMIYTFVENVQAGEKEAIVCLIQQLTTDTQNNTSGRAFEITEEKENVPLKYLKKFPVDERDTFFRPAGPLNLEELGVNNDSRTPIVTLPLNIFLDDTSTHRSKRWLALHCIQMQLSGVPMSQRHKDKNIHFIGASEKVDIMKLTELAVADIKECQKETFISYDAHNKQECVIKCPVDVIVADNNVVSLCCNHLGASAVKYCPRCHATSETFDDIIQLRTPEETKRTVRRLNLRSKEGDKAKLRKETGIKENFNCLWDIVDPHKDIPVGLLHLIPLGLAKHLLIQIVRQMDEKRIKEMGCHLQSLTPQLGTDFFKYIESRQGKDFKNYLQVAPFNLVYAGAEGPFIRLTCTLALLNMKSINNEELGELRGNIQKFHELICDHLPNFARKLKTHLLLHIIDDIERHGPPTAYDEDSFEKNHGRIRDQIFLQNQKARSRDTASKYAQHMLCHHVVTGGYFKHGESWKQASATTVHAGCDPVVESFLGWKDEPSRDPGTILRFNRNQHGRKETYPFNEETFGHQIEKEYEDQTFYRGKSMVALSKEVVNSGDWVEYTKCNDERSYGVFSEGIEFSMSSHACIIKAEKLQTYDQQLGCSLLQLTTSCEYVKASTVQRQCSIIHDCKGGHCRMRYKVAPRKVEQQKLSKKQLVFVHNDEHKIYMLNHFKL
ncbi:uncharacterized protein LOC111114859 isoform X2 [Crassostrea virginica]